MVHKKKLRLEVECYVAYVVKGVGVVKDVGLESIYAQVQLVIKKATTIVAASSIVAVKRISFSSLDSISDSGSVTHRW